MNISAVNVNGTDYDIVTKDSELPIICELGVGGSSDHVPPKDSSASYNVVGDIPVVSGGYVSPNLYASVYVKTKNGKSVLSIVVDENKMPSTT